MVDKLWLILESVVEVTNIILCYSLILQAKINTKNCRLLWVYCGIILCSGVNFFCDLGINKALIGMLYCFMLPLVLIEHNKVKWMMLYPCAFMMHSIVGIMVSFVWALILGISQGEMSESPWIAAITNSAFTIVFGLIFIYTHINKKKSKYKLYWNNKIYISVTIGTILFYLLIGMIQFIGIKHNVPVVQNNFIGLLMSGVCVVFFAFFLWLSSTIHYNEISNKEKEMLSLSLEQQKRYTQLVMEKDEQMRSFRHDVKGHMWIVAEYIKREQLDDAHSYIDKIYGQLDTADLVSYTGNYELDAIIHDMKIKMEKKGITFKWNGNGIKISKCYEVFDLCTIFTNILNNAIEACERLEDSDKVVEVVVNMDRGKLYIKESNKTNNSVIMGNDSNPISTKGDNRNHGYGCKNIRAAVEKYDGDINFSVENGMFCVEIFI